KDVERDTYEADIDKLEERVLQLINQAPQEKDVILEGHLSYFLPVDAVIVLRVNPVALRKRLGARNKYSGAKVKENANAEALDVILVESCEYCESVFEIDTTEKNALAVVKSCVSIIESLKSGESPAEFLPGNISWLDLVELD
ncbi:MAG: adenylate kinase, partial [Candidatus Methanoperedens sp.]|nr:adenylate kinase [Candidatus Methanoperedens sp.]